MNLLYPIGRELNTSRLLITNRRNIECPDSPLSDEAQQLAIAPHRGPQRQTDLYSIFDLRPSNGDMKPVSNRNCRACVADVEPATCHRSAIHRETA